MMILKTSRSNLSSNDQLALDLPFAETKSLTARVGPTPTFTRASSATFVGSNGLIQTAATNIPRFDHTAAGVCRGLLIEESRTNGFLYSEDLTQAVWGRTGSTISTNATTAPDGATTADGIVDDTTILTHRVIQSFNATAGTTYTASCFIKRNQVTDFFQITFASANFGTNNTWFNISNGTIVSSTGTASASTITSFPNGWYRVTHTVTCTVSSTAANAFFNPSTSSTTGNYTGTGVLTVYLWGAQVEAGSLATSYIPTTTGSVVRSADVCSITGANFTSFYNQNEGTIYSSFQRSNLNDNLRVLSISTNASSNATQWFKSGSNEQLQNLSPTGSYSLTLSASSLNNTKIAQAMKSENHAASMNGATPVTSTGVGLIAPDRLIIGANQTGASSLMNGTIAAIRYYRKRLSNAKIQALTL